MKTLQQLAELAEKATPQDFDSAETIKQGGYVECPYCNGEGEVELLSEYTNYDNVAIGVQFFGIGDAHVDAEEYYRACNPETIIAIAKQQEDLAEALGNIMDDWDYEWSPETGVCKEAFDIAKAALAQYEQDNTHKAQEDIGCFDCGLKYGGESWIEAVIPDKVWNAIRPKGASEHCGILCISCMASRITKLGFDRKVPLWLLGTEPFNTRTQDPCGSEEDLTILRNWELGGSNE